jgi:hypothetical protein
MSSKPLPCCAQGKSNPRCVGCVIERFCICIYLKACVYFEQVQQAVCHRMDFDADYICWAGKGALESCVAKQQYSVPCLYAWLA